jgi:SAM-dependent methyltransferase
MEITSPITGSRRVEKYRSYPAAKIIAAYQDLYGMDVSRFFSGMTEVSAYRCLDSGYVFFHPPTVAGDAVFYEELSSFPWYYMPDKWEHHRVARLLRSGEKVCEIGSGSGAFLERIGKRGASAHGVEINSKAIAEARKKGFHVSDEDFVSVFSPGHALAFDVVCSFQLMEHVPAVRTYIEASLAVLRKGGRLFISVPNNSSFLGNIDDFFLNMPPHHIGLWTEAFMENLGNFFPMRLAALHIEPLQWHHFHSYFYARIGKRIERLAGAFAEKFLFACAIPFLFLLRRRIKGHTMIGEFVKI